MPIETQPISEAMRQVTLQAIRQKGITKKDLADATGNGKAWVTKFLDGTLKTMKLDVMEKLEALLGINYFAVEKAVGQRSPLASKIAGLVDTDPAFAKLASAIDEALSQARGAFTPRFIPTPDMTRIGQEIIRIAYANEDKPGKVARLVLELLA